MLCIGFILSACTNDGQSNGAPTANAGTDQAVSSGDLTQLDASGSSDPDGDPLAYQWTQAAGIPVSLSDPTVVNPTFIAPGGMTAPEVLSFDLQVDDGRLNSVPDTVVIRVAPVIANEPDGFITTIGALLSKGHFTMNNPWTQDDLDYENIRATIDYQTIVNSKPRGRVTAHTTLMEEYLARRRQCEEDYQSFYPRASFTLVEDSGLVKDYHFTDRKCYPSLQEANALEEVIEGPIAQQVLERYGYYCGGGFPDGFGPFSVNAPEPLDSVDYCCRLHDAGTWAGHGRSSNECGMVMCLYHATVWPSGLEAQLEDSETSRQHWHDGAATACPNNGLLGQSNDAPPYEARP